MRSVIFLIKLLCRYVCMYHNYRPSYVGLIRPKKIPVLPVAVRP